MTLSLPVYGIDYAGCKTTKTPTGLCIAKTPTAQQRPKFLTGAFLLTELFIYLCIVGICILCKAYALLAAPTLVWAVLLVASLPQKPEPLALSIYQFEDEKYLAVARFFLSTVDHLELQCAALPWGEELMRAIAPAVQSSAERVGILATTNAHTNNEFTQHFLKKGRGEKVFEYRHNAIVAATAELVALIDLLKRTQQYSDETSVYRFRQSLPLVHTTLRKVQNLLNNEYHTVTRLAS